jgi:uncharacterized protein
MAIDPVVLFFVLGLVAGLARSDLKVPPAIYDLLSLILLLAIGMKGGIELARQPASGLAGDLSIVVAMGIFLTLLAFVMLLACRLSRIDAAAIAAHYGSVSVATFAVGVAYVTRAGMPYESHLPLFLVVLEVPGIVVGILLARGRARGVPWRTLLHEIFFGRSVLLLLGGLIIGWAMGEQGVAPIAPLFLDLFKGVLALFLLEMGLIAAGHLGGLRGRNLAVIGFALIAPPLFALVGIGTAAMLGLSAGGALLLATLAASASYIAAPAALRTAVPEANPALSLTAVLGITFPFNILFGLPLYDRMVQILLAAPLPG